jgi:hypothetical protein
MKKIFIIVMLAFAGSVQLVQAQKPVIVLSDKAGWHKLGETTVNFQKEFDEILVIGANRFESIKFMVNDAPIKLTSLEVFYVGNTKKSFKINNSIKDAGESRIIHLNGEHNIKKVVFIYKTLDNGTNQKAHVALWGYKTNEK